MSTRRGREKKSSGYLLLEGDDSRLGLSLSSPSWRPHPHRDKGRCNPRSGTRIHNTRETDQGGNPSKEQSDIQKTRCRGEELHENKTDNVRQRSHQVFQKAACSRPIKDVGPSTDSTTVFFFVEAAHTPKETRFNELFLAMGTLRFVSVRSCSLFLFTSTA